MGEGQQLGHQLVGVRRGQPRGGEAETEPGGVQRGLHRRAEGWVILGVHGVQGDSHEGRLGHRTPGEGGIQVGGSEPGEPVPQCEVGRSRVLCLERDHTPHAVRDGQRLTLQQQLAAEGCSVEFARADRHDAGFCPTPRAPAPVLQLW